MASAATSGAHATSASRDAARHRTTTGCEARTALTTSKTMTDAAAPKSPIPAASSRYFSSNMTISFARTVSRAQRDSVNRRSISGVRSA